MKKIFCKFCKRITNHMNIGIDKDMWKCYECGEYNSPNINNLTPNKELVLCEAEETRQQHSHGNFSSMGRDGLD